MRNFKSTEKCIARKVLRLSCFRLEYLDLALALLINEVNSDADAVKVQRQMQTSCWLNCRWLHWGSSLTVWRGRSESAVRQSKISSSGSVLAFHAVVTNLRQRRSVGFRRLAGENRLIISAAATRCWLQSVSSVVRLRPAWLYRGIKKIYIFFGNLIALMKGKKKEKNCCELLQLGVSQTRQHKQTPPSTQIYRWDAHLMYSALKLSLSNFSGGQKEKNKPSTVWLQQISGMSPVKESTRWQHWEKSFAVSLKKLFCLLSFYICFFFNSLKEQLVQIQSQLHEHDGKVFRITKQGSWCLMRE